MATEVQAGVGSNVDNSSGIDWSSPTAISVSSDSYANFTYNDGSSPDHSDFLTCTVNNFTVSGDNLISVAASVEGKQSGLPFHSAHLRFSPNGSDWTTCTGHIIATFGGSDAIRSATCTHITWTFSNIDTMAVRYYVDGIDTGSSGTCYVDYMYVTVTYTINTVPDAPADPTWSGLGTDGGDSSGKATVSSSSPADGGLSLDNVEQQIAIDTSFTLDVQIYTKGSAPSNPENHQFIGMLNGTTSSPSRITYYTRARYHNSLGWGSYNSSPYNTIDTYTYPTAQNPVSASTPSSSMIRITRNGTLPDDGGEAIDSWEVWRSSSSGGTYTQIASGLSTGVTTYDDWSVDGGETWYYKLKFVNAVGASAISTTPVNATATKIELTRLSDARILKPDNELTRLSDTRIKVSPYADITRLSDTRIKNTMEVSTESDARIQVSDNELTRVSDSRILKATDVTRASDTRIKNTLSANKLSDTRIKTLGTELTRVSDTRIIHRPTLLRTSDSRILKSGELSRTSDARILGIGLFPKFSDARIKVPAYGHKQIISDSRIQIVDNEITRLSDSRIAVPTEVTRGSDTRILVPGWGHITRNSDSRIKNTDEVTRLSKTRIKVLDQEVTRISNSRIQIIKNRLSRLSDASILRRTQFTRLSNSRIMTIDNELTRVSNTRIQRTYADTRLSDARMKRTGKQISRSSNSRIQVLDNELTRLSDTRIGIVSMLIRLSDSRIKNTMSTVRSSDANIGVLDNEITHISDSRILKTFEMTRTSDARIRALRGNLKGEFTKVRVL